MTNAEPLSQDEVREVIEMWMDASGPALDLIRHMLYGKKPFAQDDAKFWARVVRALVRHKGVIPDLEARVDGYVATVEFTNRESAAALVDELKRFAEADLAEEDRLRAYMTDIKRRGLRLAPEPAPPTAG
ncbi:MAG TPA: hypothetical protein VGK94_08475 [Candidatus Polarisedimenticolia bacterium]